MRRQLNTRQPRPGFTLVELTIVVAIIAVLAALLLGAIGKARDAGKRTQTITEMGILEAAAGKFKIDYGFYPPDYMEFPPVVTNPLAPPIPTPEQAKTIALFAKMFRGYDYYGRPGDTPPKPSNATRKIRFLATVDPSTDAFISGYADDLRGNKLFGSQCMVFFLGGPKLQGFATTGPYDPGSSNSKKMAYYEYTDSRVLAVDPEPGRGYQGFHLDPYGTPYAYFSTVQGEGYPDDANHLFTFDGSVRLKAFRSIAATGAPLNVPAKFFNPNKIQIISAGPNETFGSNCNLAGVAQPFTPGMSSVTGQPEAGYGAAQAGEDDIANFNGTVPLGSQGK